MKKTIDPSVNELESIEKLVQGLLLHFGLNLKDENLQDTPKRIAKMFKQEFFASVGKVVSKKGLTTFSNGEYDEVILFDKISFVSCCPHHLLPYHGHAHLAYLPDKVIIGSSKPDRLIDFLCHQPIIQESLSLAIADIFMEVVKPKGMMLIMRGIHSCKTCRGVKASFESGMTTSVTRGVFRTNLDIRLETLQLIQFAIKC